MYLPDRFVKHFFSRFNEKLSEEVPLWETANICLVKIMLGLRAGQCTQGTWLLPQCEGVEDMGF